MSDSIFQHLPSGHQVFPTQNTRQKKYKICSRIHLSSPRFPDIFEDCNKCKQQQYTGYRKYPELQSQIQSECKDRSHQTQIQVQAAQKLSLIHISLLYNSTSPSTCPYRKYNNQNWSAGSIIDMQYSKIRLPEGSFRQTDDSILSPSRYRSSGRWDCRLWSWQSTGLRPL